MDSYLNNIPGIKNEEKIVLICARTYLSQETKTVLFEELQKDLDWDFLLEFATINKLTTLLYYNLNSFYPEMVPKLILTNLKNYFHSNVQKNLHMKGELIKILKLFLTNNIESIPFKGPVLADLAYGNISLREFNDLDIFVKKTNLTKVYDIMLFLGYELVSYPKKIDKSLYFKTQSEHKFINKNNNIIVEIHNKFQGHFFSFPTNPEFLYTKDSLKIIYANNNPINTLSNENLILFLCIHCSRHDWSKLFWICDISELLKSHEFNYSELFENAEKLGIKRILLINLFLASELFGLELSELSLNEIKNDPNIENMSRKLERRLFSNNNRFLNIFERTMLDLKKRDTLKMGLMDVFNTMFKPTFVDFEELPLPPSLYALYYIIRPFLLLKRYGKNSI